MSEADDSSDRSNGNFLPYRFGFHFLSEQGKKGDEKMLKIENVTKIFNPGTVNEKMALNHLDLVVQDGDFITLLGSNGAGKSTTMNIMTGYIAPTSGQVLINWQSAIIF